MRVHLIRKETIEVFAKKNARSRASFADWLEKIRNAEWEIPLDMKETFGATDLLGQRSNRAVFDIGGNSFRIICKYAFGERQVHMFVCWIGTHVEYQKLCNERKQYTVSNY